MLQQREYNSVTFCLPDSHSTLTCKFTNNHSNTHTRLSFNWRGSTNNNCIGFYLWICLCIKIDATVRILCVVCVCTGNNVCLCVCLIVHLYLCAEIPHLAEICAIPRSSFPISHALIFSSSKHDHCFHHNSRSCLFNLFVSSLQRVNLCFTFKTKRACV
jgi:hypothetical protein